MIGSMKVFTSDQYRRAARFLETRARPLEHLRFLHDRKEASAADVVTELCRYQNEDGGFGRALEPDMRSPQSSVLATTEALFILKELGDDEACTAPAANAVAWLLSSASGYDGERNIWPYLIVLNEDAAHAPWWNLEQLEECFDGFLINPFTRITALLLHWADLVPGGLDGDYLSSLVETSLVRAESLTGTPPPDTLRSLLMLRESPLSGESRLRLEQLLPDMIRNAVVTDPAGWTEYGLQPLEVVSGPSEYGHTILGKALKLQLDYLIDTQEESGSWKPFWHWAGAFPETWKQAEQEWSGVLTLRYLRILAAFGRMES